MRETGNISRILMRIPSTKLTSKEGKKENAITFIFVAWT
jgi:hypothetical protein